MKPIETVIEGLRKAAIELEAFQVQAALGKAEAKDKFAEARKKFNTLLHEAEISLDKTASDVKEKYKDVKPMLESIKVQFALGKAEARDLVDEQRKNFNNTLNKLESFLKTINQTK